MEHSGSDETSARSAEQENVLDEGGDDNVAANANTDDDIHEADLGNTRADVYLKSLREMEKLIACRSIRHRIRRIRKRVKIMFKRRGMTSALLRDITVPESTLRRLNESVEGITNLSETTAMMLRVSIVVKKNYA